MRVARFSCSLEDDDDDGCSFFADIPRLVVFFLFVIALSYVCVCDFAQQIKTRLKASTFSRWFNQCCIFSSCVEGGKKSIAYVQMRYKHNIEVLSGSSSCSVLRVADELHFSATSKHPLRQESSKKTGTRWPAPGSRNRGKEITRCFAVEDTWRILRVMMGELEAMLGLERVILVVATDDCSVLAQSRPSDWEDSPGETKKILHSRKKISVLIYLKSDHSIAQIVKPRLERCLIGKHLSNDIIHRRLQLEWGDQEEASLHSDGTYPSDIRNSIDTVGEFALI